jgi:hypothetical protein
MPQQASLHRHLRAAPGLGRFGLGVVTGLVLAVALLSSCGADSTEWDTLTVNQHLYLRDPEGAKVEVGVGKDATGKDILVLTPAE